MTNYDVLQAKAKVLYENYVRKPDNQHQTHYCPGCGHGIAHKLIASAIDELGVQDRTVLVSPVGCSVFAYYYFDVGNVQAAHGRAPAVATAIKRARPDSIVISYQGDGDLAAIGSAEILHAANRGEPITVFFVNNAIYGMTGGQMAPTTPIGRRSTTSPEGRSIWNEGYPLHVCELLASLDAPVYLERVALGNSKQIIGASKAIHRAIDNQVRGLGFSLIEILSPCPTIFKMDPVEAQHWVRDELTKVYPLGVFRDRRQDAPRRPEPAAKPSLEAIACEPAQSKPVQGARLKTGLRIKVAGFGGQGVLMLGEVLAEAGLGAGLNVSWLPSYGPEMRSGTSNCHVRLSNLPIDTPLVSKPNVLFALNEPSLRKFIDSVEPGGWVLYNGSEIPDGVDRGDVQWIARPFAEIADQAGGAKAANIVMLGALLEAVGCLPAEAIHSALERLVHSERWLDLDRLALAKGREAFLSRTVAV